MKLAMYGVILAGLKLRSNNITVMFCYIYSDKLNDHTKVIILLM